MALLNTISTALTNEIAGRGSIRHNSVEGTKVGSCTTAAAADDNSTFVFVRIPTDAVMTSVVFTATDFGITGTVNLGFHPGNLAASALLDTNAVDEDAIATAIDINAAAVGMTEVRLEALTATSIGKKAWEVAGLSAKPTAYGEFFVTGTLAAATTAAGTMAVIVKFL